MISPLATFLNPSDDVIKADRANKKRRIKYKVIALSFTQWKRKYSHFLRILYINYLHESKFTVDEYRGGFIMTYEQFSQHFYRAKLSSSFNPQNGGRIVSKYEMSIAKIHE